MCRSEYGRRGVGPPGRCAWVSVRPRRCINADGDGACGRMEGDVRRFPSTARGQAKTVFVPFDPVADYDAYVDGKPPRRRDAILPEGTVNLSNPRAIFAGSPPRFTRSRVTYEAYVVSRTSTRPQVDSALVSGDARFLSWGRRREKASAFPGAARRPLPLEISGRRVCHDPGQMVADIRPDTGHPERRAADCVRDDGRPAGQCDKRCWLHRRPPRPVPLAVRDLADVTTVWTAVIGSARSRLPVLFTSVRRPPHMRG